jgi:hypothetical protein
MPNRMSAWRAFFLLIGVLVLPALACDFSVSTATITNGVMANDVKGDNFDPVGITDSFPANVSILHAVVTISNAPSDTAVKVVWLDPSNTSIGEYTIKAEGTRNLDFSFKPNGAMPAGNYKAEIYLDGKLDRTLVFTVQAPQVQPTVVPTKPPPPAAGCPPLQPASAKQSGIVASVTLAQDVKGDLKEPVNPTTVFKPESIFHAVTAIQNAPANSKFTATWFANDVGSAAPCNTKIDSADVVTSGSANIDFSLKPTANWPVGTYRVEIMVNGVLDRIVSFSVGASSSGQPTAAPPTQAKPTAAPVKPTTAPPTAAPTTAPTAASGRPPIPAGQGGLIVVSSYGKEINFTINNVLYKIPPNGTLTVFLPPGKYPYSANIPGIGSASDVVEITAGQWFKQTFSE